MGAPIYPPPQENPDMRRGLHVQMPTGAKQPHMYLLSLTSENNPALKWSSSSLYDTPLWAWALLWYNPHRNGLPWPNYFLEAGLLAGGSHT